MPEQIVDPEKLGLVKRDEQVKVASAPQIVVDPVKMGLTKRKETPLTTVTASTTTVDLDKLGLKPRENQFTLVDPSKLGLKPRKDPWSNIVEAEGTATYSPVLRSPKGSTIVGRFFSEGKDILTAATLAPFYIIPRQIELHKWAWKARQAKTPSQYHSAIMAMGLDPKDFPFEKRWVGFIRPPAENLSGDVSKLFEPQTAFKTQDPMAVVNRKALKQMWSDIVTDYKEYFERPLDRVSERPFSAALDASILAGPFGRGLKFLGKAGRVSGIGKIARTGKALEKTGAFIEKGPYAMGKAGIEELFGGAERVKAYKDISYAYSREKNLAIRRSEMAGVPIDDALKKVPGMDYPAFREYAEGLRPLAEASKETQNAIRKLGAEMEAQWDSIVKMGGGTPETGVTRRFKPLLDHLKEQSKGLTPEKAAVWEKRLKVARKVQRIQKKEALGIKLTVNETAFIEKNPINPIYFPHINEKLSKVAKMGSANVSGVPHKYKAGFSKKFDNVKMPLADAKTAYRQYTNAVESWKGHMRYIERITKMPGVINLKDFSKAAVEKKFGRDVWERYSILAPESTTSFKGGGRAGEKIMRDIMKTGDPEGALLKYHKEMVVESWEAAKKASLARRSAITAFQEKRGIKPIGEGVYLMPKKAAEAVRAQMGTPGFLDPALYHYDRLTGKLKKMWLTLPGLKWFQNNQLGNITFGALQGLLPEDYLKALYSKFKGVIPDEMGAGFVKIEAKAAGKGSWTAERGMWKYLEESAPGKVLGNYSDKVLHYNGMVEDWFRRAAYIHEADKLARQRLMKRTGNRWYLTEGAVLREMKAIKKNTKLSEGLIDNVEEFFGNYTKMLPVERRVFRRIVPFYNWLKHINLLTVKLPTKFPKRTWLIREIAKASEEAWEDMSDYARGESVIIGKGSDGSPITMSLHGLPFTDVGPETFLQGLHPIIGEVLERSFGKQRYNMKDFTYPSSMYIKVGDKFYEPIPGQQPNAAGDYRAEQLRLVETPRPHWSRVLRLIPPVRFGENMMFPYRRPTGGAIWDPTPLGTPFKPTRRDRGYAALSFLGPTIYKSSITPAKGRQMERIGKKKARGAQREARKMEEKAARKLGIYTEDE